MVRTIYIFLILIMKGKFYRVVCFQLDGSKMSPDYRVPPIVVYERKDSKWTLKDKHT